MSNSRPTHLVRFNDQAIIRNEKGFMYQGLYEVETLDYDPNVEPVTPSERMLRMGVEKVGTFEECTAYAEQLNKEHSEGINQILSPSPLNNFEGLE